MNAADVAKTWIGTPWHHQASLKGKGCDCIGLVGGVGVELGITEALAWERDPRWKGYDKRPDGRLIEEACAELLQPVPLDAIDLGDILVLRWKSERYPMHLAIVSRMSPTYIIHAYAPAKKVVENRLDGIWRARVIKAFRFR